MPAGKKSESLPQISCTTVNTQNQLKLNRMFVDSALSRTSNETSSSNSEVTKILKRPPLQYELDIDAKIKKIRLAENREEQYENNSLINENYMEEHHISLLIGKLDEIAVADEINGDKHPYVSNESNNGSIENDSFINNFIDGSNNIGTNIQEVCCNSKMSVSKKGKNSEKKSSKIKNDLNNCVPQVMKNNNENEENDDIIIENDHQLTRPSSSQNVIALGSSEDEDVEGDCLITKNIESNKNNDLQLCMYNSTQTLIKSTNGIEPITNELENNNEVGKKISIPIGVNNGSNTIRESEHENDIIIEAVIQSNRKMARQVLFELFSYKDNITERWTTFLSYKVMEYLAHKDFRGQERRDAENIILNQKFWNERFKRLASSLIECRIFVRNHVKNFPNFRRDHRVLRSVALQVDLCGFKENGGNKIQSLKQLRAKQLSDRNTVDISSDDDDLILVNTKQSSKTSRSASTSTEVDPETLMASTSTEVNPETLIASTSTEVNPETLIASTSKAVSRAIPINPPAIINIDPIDLTGYDEIYDVPINLNLDKTSKIIKRPTINASTSVTSSKQLTKNSSTQVLTKKVTLIEVPKLSTPSNYIVKTTSATGSNQLSKGLSLKTLRIKPNSSSSLPFAVDSSGKFLRIINPNAVSLTPNQIKQLPKSQLIRPQVTMSQSTKPQLTMVQSTRPQLTMVQSTKPQLTVTQSTSSQLAMVQSTRPQQTITMPPVPPALPLFNPFRQLPQLPSSPNQTTLPSMKRLPSAPILTAKETAPSQVTLSWTVAKYTRPHIARIIRYQLFLYFENNNTPELPRLDSWVQIGEVAPYLLPMACSVNHLRRQQRFFFTVRAVDEYNRFGPCSLPKMVNLS